MGDTVRNMVIRNDARLKQLEARMAQLEAELGIRAEVEPAKPPTDVAPEASEDNG